jgi:mannan endo-1,4-beta-mannosidase
MRFPLRRARDSRLIATLVLLVLADACWPVGPSASPHPPIPSFPLNSPIDSRATPETRALFLNLRRLAREHVLFGHQDDLAYGYAWVAEPGRSDVKESSGSYPAVYGWEVSGLESDSPRNIDGVDFQRMRGWIAEGYRRGGVITISWHVNNPLTGRNAWDTTSAVATVLPGGARHEHFKASLDKLAAFLGSLRAPPRDGAADAPIPVIFRPWHELTGGWFWWGVPHTKGDEFARLWHFTVEYLRDVKGLHNLLYAYAPNAAGPTGVDTYMAGYPGDAYVDVLGYDRYLDPPVSEAQMQGFTRELSWVVRQAESRGKIPALTETGMNAVRDSTFWTGRLARIIEGDSVSRRIAYVMVWRNANRAARNDEHFFAPYRGHSSEQDFRRFKADPLFLFEDALPNLYRPASTR